MNASTSLEVLDGRTWDEFPRVGATTDDETSREPRDEARSIR